jgi:hypothetical protein
MITKIRKGETYLLHWKRNPALWNDDLKKLISHNIVKKINKQYYSRVVAHYTGQFDVVDCTCNNKGDYYPIMVCNLKENPE